MRNKITRFLVFFLSLIPFIALLIFTANVLFKPGYIYHTDVTESTDVSNLYQRYIYTYSNDLGEALAEKARIPTFFAVYGVFKLAKVFGADDSLYVKIKILALLVISYSFFVIYIYKLMSILSNKDEQRLSSWVGIVAGANIAGLCYVTNYWFVNRIMHFGLFFSTALLPITFYYLYRFFYHDSSFKNLVKLSIFSSIFSATPHTLLMTGLLSGVLAIVYLVTYREGLKVKLSKLAKLGAYQVLFLAVNSYWLLPYLISLSTPDAVLSETIVNLLAKNASIVNGINLTGYWLTIPGTYFHQPLNLINQLVSFVPALFLAGFFLFFWRKNRPLALTGLITALASLFFATSSKLSNPLYFFLMFDSPLKAWGWLFREYDKIGIVLAFCYALATALTLSKCWKKLYLTIPLLVLAVAYLCGNFYFYAKTLTEKYTPVTVPQEYSQVINLLKSDPQDFNTAWYPGVIQPYWAKNEEVRFVFTNLLSPKPAITTRSEYINYLDYLTDIENIYGVNTGKALDMLGIKYLIIRRDDQLFKKNALADELEIQDSLEKVLTTTNLTVFKNTLFSGLTKYTTERLSTNLGLETLKYLDNVGADTKYTLVDYTDKPAGVDLAPTIYLVANNELLDTALQSYTGQFIYPYNYTHKKEDGNPGYWKLGSLENINHAETRFFFTNLGLTLPQFDYTGGVVIARDGWQKKTDFNPNSTNHLDIRFSPQSNLQQTGSNIKYTAQGSDFGYYWNIQRSNKLPVSNVEALQLRLSPNIPDYLVPHFKITSYDSEDKLLETEAVYPNEQNLLDTIIKIPRDAAKIDFSIWTLSYPKEGQTVLYTYDIKNLSLEDITNQVEPVSLSFTQKAPCKQECWIYARVLKSKLGGNLQIELNNKIYQVDTNTHETDESPIPERYTWLELGKIDQAEDRLKIRLTNLSGFNSVNALALLTNEQHDQLTQKINSIPVEKDFGARVPRQSFITTTMLNPTLYQLDVIGETKQAGVLIFAKPYSKNWRLSSLTQPPIIANGYVNGWYMSDLKPGTYYIEYTPQKYFYIGTVISVATFLTAVAYLIVVREVKASPVNSTSQG